MANIPSEALVGTWINYTGRCQPERNKSCLPLFSCSPNELDFWISYLPLQVSEGYASLIKHVLLPKMVEDPFTYWPILYQNRARARKPKARSQDLNVR